MNKMYFNLLKISESNPSTAEDSIKQEYKPQSEAISPDRVLTLISRMATEKLIGPEQEAQYYQELVEIQTRLEEIPVQLAIKSSLINQTLLKPISLDSSIEHGNLASNAKTLLSMTEPPQAQPQVQPPSPAFRIPIKSPRFYVILGLFFGLLVGLIVASIKFFFEKNWDVIKARINT